MPDPQEGPAGAKTRTDDSLGGPRKYRLGRPTRTASQEEAYARVESIVTELMTPRMFPEDKIVPHKDMTLISLSRSDLAVFDIGMSGQHGTFFYPSMAASLKGLNRDLLPHARSRGFEGAEAKNSPQELAEAYGYLAAPQDGGKPSRLIRLATLLTQSEKHQNPRNTASIKPLWDDVRPKLLSIMAHPSNAKIIELYAEWMAAPEKDLPPISPLTFDPLARAFRPTANPLHLLRMARERIEQGKWK